jgi:5-oxoprolinase (ATP-hydrolysing)
MKISIDRGGTFTDIYVEISGRFFQEKLLSNDPDHYDDAALEGLKRVLSKIHPELPPNSPLNTQAVQWIRMGTTLATNALLENKVEPVLLLITQGFNDLLKIGDQSRPQLFNLNIPPLKSFYQSVLGVNERVLPTPNGFKVLQAPDGAEIEASLRHAYGQGMRAVAVVLMHGYEFTEHEVLIGKLAKSIGFEQVSLSHEVMPSIKILERGNITVLDACLSPLIHSYVTRFQKGFTSNLPENKLFFMQSHGGLCKAKEFRGANSLLSGPAGGILGYGHSFYQGTPLIGFDMGGTSTDVSRFAGELEITLEHRLHHLPLRIPQLDIQTVAAGGGSRLFYRHGLFQVGPESSGAHPGPLCYRKNGFLSLTDANVFLGRIQAHLFPRIFGADHSQPLDFEASRNGFLRLTEKINRDQKQQRKPLLTAEQVAIGFVDVANETMMKPIREISVSRGFDPKDHALVCFGGAGGQHGCAIARILGIETLFIHRHAGILSAVGLHLANQSKQVYHPACFEFSQESKSRVDALFQRIIESKTAEAPELSKISKWTNLRFEGTKTPLMIPYIENLDSISAFLDQYQKLFGFILENRRILVDEIRVDFAQNEGETERPRLKKTTGKPTSLDSKPCYFESGWQKTPIYDLDSLRAGDRLTGPALVISADSTLLIEPEFQAKVSTYGDIKIQVPKNLEGEDRSVHEDPVKLSIFQNRFMSLAEQMGQMLQKTASSTNIQERLDFSCALFDHSGNLVANAPHIPVHLGSMSTCIKKALESYPAGQKPENLCDSDVLISNLPSQGGTHLPDITLISPYFRDGKLLALVASRGHHADIGGISPGSMPSSSTTLEQEGVQIPVMKLVKDGKFQEKMISQILASAGARKIEENLADLKAQIAANQQGLTQLDELMQALSKTTALEAMTSIQKISEVAVQNFLKAAPKNHLQAQDQMDDGSLLCLEIKIDSTNGSAIFDFAGTAKENEGNLNAPLAVTTACIMYCLRCLVQEELPLNEGFLRPIKIAIEPGSLLNPSPEKAIAAGNVTTSQRIVDLIFKAFKFCGASQGCMNSLSFGNASFGYYETLGGGAGAGSNYHGASAVHTHMTNTKITDPEILETRYPVQVCEFSIRHGSGGDGRLRGGNGLIREFEFLEDLRVELLTERRATTPFGMQGGQSGKPGKNWVCKQSETLPTQPKSSWKSLPGRCSLNMKAGDKIRIETPGGGGFGDGVVSS